MSVKKIIAIASAKGGVGKSSITALLAANLSKNLKIGILDADIYGPNQHILFDVENNKPEVTDINGSKKFIPVTVQNNIKINSMGFILDNEKAAIWRGPMLSGAIKQLMDSTIWDDLDILFVDMPPGTGDAYLTVSSEIQPDHAILITTPNKLAIHDALKSLSTFSKLKTNVLGFIENNLFQQNVKQSYSDLVSSNTKFIGSLSFDDSIHNFDFFRSNEEINHITSYLLELLNESY